ncbi:Site-specific recombinase XerD [Marinobacter persicus]|uniref:Site-specific recombinase XerD n=1 Tax=Marinobacter persicus TaxID=930118 RepID=A0A1I3R2X1_9GAMM|nr:tyrosine-type recombinase/integrase [Marinobacter persicus]GHD43490.1 hypothetical protein GCM10008110_07500 [Marinobacter persicus]SFJ40933.1 Site-specific recombinase XerD [Marinobacter persicus]
MKVLNECGKSVKLFVELRQNGGCKVPGFWFFDGKKLVASADRLGPACMVAPGTIAVSASGRQWMAVGGDSENGAAGWSFVSPCVEQPPVEGEAVQFNNNPKSLKIRAKLDTYLEYFRSVKGYMPRSVVLRSEQLMTVGALPGQLYKHVRPISIPEREMGYLELGQIKQILQEIRQGSKNPHVYLVTRLSLETGARWSEAEGLTLARLKPYRVTYDQTKSGKKRSVPISKAFYLELKEHLEEWGSFGTSTISAFRRAVDRTGIQLPDGQCAHILRHTFASHFMMNGGNILALQKILGHSSIAMTMRYAHLAPDHLEEAVTLNPMCSVDVSLTPEEKTEGQKRKKPLKSGA